MRMWLCNPRILCQKHLCGEHVELHMTLGSIKKGISINGYLKNNLLEPRAIFQRHKDLSEEMISRGYNHKSDIKECDCECVLNLDEEQQCWEIDKDKALKDLLERCPECRKRYASLTRTWKRS